MPRAGHSLLKKPVPRKLADREALGPGHQIRKYLARKCPGKETCCPENTLLRRLPEHARHGGRIPMRLMTTIKTGIARVD